MYQSVMFVSIFFTCVDFCMCVLASSGLFEDQYSNNWSRR